MNIFDWRKPARPNHISNKYSVSAYSTDTRTEMKGEIKDMLPPDLLQSELTKTIMADVTTKKAGKIENGSDTWIMGMFSTMFNAISKRLIGRAESGPYYGVVDKETLSFWRSSKTENKNIGAQDTSYTVSIDMNGDHKSPVAACEDKLNSIRHLLSSKSVPIAPKQNTYRSRRPKKVFVESSSVEDHFEDAFAPEDFISHPNIDCISYIIPNRIQDLEYFEVDTPKMRVETGQVSENGSIAKASPEIHKSLSKEKNVSKTIINSENKSNLLVEPEKTEIVVHIDAVGVDTMALEKKETVMSCEEKMLKLKTMLQERCKKNTKATLNLSDSNVESVTLRSIETKGPPKMVPTNKCKDKCYKNPNRLSKDKRKKCGIRRAIQEDMHSDETFNDDASSLENSPTITQINHSIENLASSVEHDDYFDEVAGRFIPNTGAENDDSFQVVFTDIPQIKRNWRPSDCESEDSFIVFEESPDSCYTSNDVFGDDTDSEAEYSDSEVSDSGCGLDEVRTLCLDSISKSVSDLTDDSLYVERALVDEVDCAVRICEEIPSSDIAEVCDLSEQESTSMSVLLNDTKKLLRKNQPPKKVHFSEKPPKVHVLRVWAFAARQARPGHWERYAIDRERFKRRIADADMALSWVLKPQHRSRVMFQRFMPWWNKQKRIELAEKKQREEEEKKKHAEEEKED
ncbi:protein phosphatase 1 regulatory subunit 15 [Aphomia sociella]